MQFLDKKNEKNLEKSGRSCEKIAEKFPEMSRMKHFNIKNFNTIAAKHTIFAIPCCTVLKMKNAAFPSRCGVEKAALFQQKCNVRIT